MCLVLVEHFRVCCHSPTTWTLCLFALPPRASDSPCHKEAAAASLRPRYFDVRRAIAEVPPHAILGVSGQHVVRAAACTGP